MTIFEKIIAREIPAKIIWEDDDAIAFQDVNPQAPVHVLIVPKKVISTAERGDAKDHALLGKVDGRRRRTGEETRDRQDGLSGCDQQRTGCRRKRSASARSFVRQTCLGLAAGVTR